MMKKLSAALSALLIAVLLVCSSMSALAIGPTEDGVYEVPVEMWHAEKDKTSMGDKYLVHTGLLTVKNGEKTLTVVPTETSSDMQMWYYKNGGVEGDTVEIKQGGSVELAGKTYNVSFTFPVKSSTQYVGVKFAASMMPVSPSARIKIDYANAKKISGDSSKEEKTTKASKDKSSDSKDDKKTEDTTAEETKKDDSTEAKAAESSDEVDANTEATAEEEKATEETKSSSKAPLIIGIIAAVVVICAVIVTVIVVKTKKK